MKEKIFNKKVLVQIASGIGGALLCLAVILIVTNLNKREQEKPAEPARPGTEIIVLDDSWEFLETITTNSHPSNTQERVYKYVSQTLVLVETNDGNHAMQPLYTYDVYAKVAP